MKRSLLRSISYLPVLFLLAFTCNKNNDDVNSNNPTGPAVTRVMDGLLATVGVGRTGSADTLVYVHRSTGSELEGYLKGAQGPDEEVRINVHGNGVFSIERKKPYISGGRPYSFFASSEKLTVNAGFPGIDYEYILQKDYSPEAEFKIVWEGDKFTIESKIHPGLYFRPTKWANATYPTQTELVLTPTKYFFFFLKN